MKRFIKKLALYLVAFLAVDVCLCAMVDPYNVMHVSSIRDNGVEPNKNYIKMTYILKNPDKFDAFVFGASRVGSLHVEKITGERCYNMTYSAGLPREHLANIKTLLNAGVVPKKIYLGVDSFSYTEDPDLHFHQPLRIPYEYLKENRIEFFKEYFDPAVAFNALEQVIFGHTPTEDYAERFYAYGWDIDYRRETAYDFEKAMPDIGQDMRPSETLAEIAEIAALCRENGIELVVFTNPMYKVTHRASLERDYLAFLKGLAAVTPFYNFSGYNAVTVDSGNYIDSSHYNAEIGDMLIDCMCSGARYDGLYEEGFGVYVTQDNIDDLIELLSSQEPPQA